MASRQQASLEADEKNTAALERRVSRGLSRGPPALEEPEKAYASASDQLSIQDLVEQQLGLRKSTYAEPYEDKSQVSSLLPQQSGIGHFPEDGSLSRLRTLANKRAGASHLGPEASKRDSPLYRQAQEDGYFKRPLGAAPRASASQVSSDSGAKHSQRKGDSKIQLGRVAPRLSSLSSPDLRTLRSGGREPQPPVAISTCKSEQNLLVPPKNEDIMSESQLVAREQFGHFRSTPKNPASQFSSTAGSIQVPACRSVSSDSQSWPAPPGMLLPPVFVEKSRIDLGMICAGAPRQVVLALVNPTAENQCYQIQQLRSSIGGRVPKPSETVIAQFPGQHTVAGGCVAKIRGSFLSTSPGAVEITVGIVVEDKAHGDAQNLHSVALVAQVEQPGIILEPSQTTNFEGLHLDA